MLYKYDDGRFLHQSQIQYVSLATIIEGLHLILFEPIINLNGLHWIRANLSLYASTSAKPMPCRCHASVRSAVLMT